MIDTKEVWRKINSTDPMDHIDLHVTIMTLLPSLLNRLEVAESDCLEQARLNGMSASREAALMTKLEAAEKERDNANAAAVDIALREEVMNPTETVSRLRRLVNDWRKEEKQLCELFMDEIIPHSLRARRIKDAQAIDAAIEMIERMAKLEAAEQGKRKISEERDGLRAKIEAMRGHPPYVAIEKILTEVMDIAAANGADSRSMPDEYVEVAAWLCGVPSAQPAPSVPDGWPTEEMTTAFTRVFNSRDQYGTFPQAFRAALAAAPEAKQYVLTKVVQYHQLAKMEKERDTLRTHLDFAKDELNKLRADIEIMKQQSNLSIPDPMDIFTDQDLLKVAEAWREFDAPSGADEFGRRIYGSIRSALNAYRDRLITLRRMEIIPTDLS